MVAHDHFIIMIGFSSLHRFAMKLNRNDGWNNQLFLNKMWELLDTHKTEKCKVPSNKRSL